MRTQLKLGILTVVFVMLVGFFLSQAHAASDDVIVFNNGKQIVEISPEPTIDCGEPGDDPHLGIGVRPVVVGATLNTSATHDSEIWRRDGSNRYGTLRQFILFWLRQLI